MPPSFHQRDPDRPGHTSLRRDDYSPSLIRSTRRVCVRALYTRRLTIVPGFSPEIAFRRSAGERIVVPSTSRMMSGPPWSGSTSSPYDGPARLHVGHQGAALLGLELELAHVVLIHRRHGDAELADRRRRIVRRCRRSRPCCRSRRCPSRPAAPAASPRHVFRTPPFRATSTLTRLPGLAERDLLLQLADVLDRLAVHRDDDVARPRDRPSGRARRRCRSPRPPRPRTSGRPT